MSECVCHCDGERYHTVAEVTAGKRDHEVNRMLLEGWALYGPPHTHNGRYIQVMTRGVLVQKQT
jgi:hypothetical protein